MSNRNIVDYEVVILGTGPAGLQAAIHAARAKVSVLVLGRFENSSIVGAHIENYCCMPYITGDELLKNGIEQARKAGAEFIEEDVIETALDGELVVLKSESGKTIRTPSLIFTIGVTRNTLNVPGETDFRGYGVSYCVDCDANFYKEKPVVITGNGSAAVSGALTLSSYSDTVYLVSEKINVDSKLSQQLSESKVKVIEGERVVAISGDKNVESVKLGNGTEVKADGIFIELGAKGAMELAGFLGIEMDENFKHIAVNRKQETSVPGIYAAGDICGPPWQIAKAVGEGCVAGLEAAKYVKKLR
jgi:thioredoxin reductase (NADPH)